MVYGGVTRDTIRTNDDTFWSGEPRDLQRPGTYKVLPEIRKLLLEEKNQEAQKVIDANLLGPWNQNYMPLADILLEWPGDGNVSGYRRELDLNRGVVTITYAQNGINYKRELFASYPDQAIVMNISADKKNAIEFTAGLGSQIESGVKVEDDQVVIDGQAPYHTDPNYTGVHPPVYKEGKGMRFEGRLLVKQEGGSVTPSGDKLHVKEATSATLALWRQPVLTVLTKTLIRMEKMKRRFAGNILLRWRQRSIPTCIKHMWLIMLLCSGG